MDRPQTSSIPIDELTGRGASHVDHHPHMLLAGRLGDECEPSHLGLHDDAVAAVQSHHHSFGDPLYGDNGSPSGSLGESVSRRGSLNRTVGDIWKLDFIDKPSNQREETAPHRFDFG